MEITLVGDVGVRTRSGRSVGPPLRGARARITLAMLALHGADGVARADLADAIWPDGPPSTWESALRTVASQVRRFLVESLRLSDDPVAASDGRYLLRLPPAAKFDVQVAEDRLARAATSLRDGDLTAARNLAAQAAERLRGTFLRGAGGPWVEEQRERVAEMRARALELQSEAALASGDPTSALAVADEAAELAPLRESAHRLRMAAHAAAGNRAEALAVYQQLRRRLVDHFGVDPSAETEAAYLALLGAVPSGPPEPPPVDEATAPVAPSLAGATLPFVGRKHELGVLADAWKHACAGDAPVVLVTGEPGIGKSRLAVEAARRITDDGRVLFGRCDEQGLVPYQPFVEALDAHVAATPSDEMPALDERALAELASVLPSLSRSRRPRTRRSRGALFEAIVALIGSVAAERPLLLVLDDLHWADPDTLLLLRHLVRRSDDMQLLLLLASRDPSPVLGGLGEVVGNLDRAGLLHRLPLPGLDEAEVRALVRSLFGRAAADPGTLRSLLAETGGNPFLLGELLRAGTAAPADHGPAPRELDGMPDAWSPAATTGTSGQLAGPSSPDLPIPHAVRDLAATRLSRLAPTTVDLLRACAVAGARFDFGAVADAAGLDEDAALDALDEAIAAGLVIEETPEHYRFQHEVMRRALDAQLSGARRRALHRRLADALERLPDARSTHAAALAHHTDAAAGPGGDARAVHWARIAAEQAGARAALSEAVRLYRQALGHVPTTDPALRADVTTDLGAALSRTGDPGAAEVLIEGALLARRHDRDDVLARAALHFADLAEDQPYLHVEARDLVEVALRATDEPSRRDPDTALVHARLLVRDERLAAAAGAGGEGVPGRVPGHALVALRNHLSTLVGPARLEERTGLADELETLAARAGDDRSRVVAVHERAMAAATSHDEATLAAALDVLTELVRHTDDALGEALLAEHAVAVCIQEGRLADVPGTLAAAAAAREELGDDPTGVLRRHVPVIRWLRAPGSGWPGSGSGDESIFTEAGTALLLLARGEPGRARIVVRELLAGLRPLAPGDELLHDLGLVALAAAELGDSQLVAGARRLLAPYADLRCGAGHLSYVGSAAFHLGRLAALDGDWADAERHLLVALRHHAGVPARPWVAFAQSVLADVLEARGRPSDREWISALRSEAGWVTTGLGLRTPGPLGPAASGEAGVAAGARA